MTPGTPDAASKGRRVDVSRRPLAQPRAAAARRERCRADEALDVALLQRHVLAPLLGVGDPRTDKRIDFVGGIRGPAELERLVNDRKAAVAFSMFPVSVDDLDGHRRRRRHHAAEIHLVRAETQRRHPGASDLISGRRSPFHGSPFPEIREPCQNAEPGTWNEERGMT